MEVERVKTLDNLIDQSEQLGEKFKNDDVFNENFDKFCDVDQKIIKKSPKSRQKGPVCVNVLFFDDSSTLFDGFRVLWKFLWILIVSV